MEAIQCKQYDESWPTTDGENHIYYFTPPFYKLQPNINKILMCI